MQIQQLNKKNIPFNLFIPNYRQLITKIQDLIDKLVYTDFKNIYHDVRSFMQDHNLFDQFAAFADFYQTDVSLVDPLIFLLFLKTTNIVVAASSYAEMAQKYFRQTHEIYKSNEYDEKVQLNKSKVLHALEQEEQKLSGGRLKSRVSILPISFGGDDGEEEKVEYQYLPLKTHIYNLNENDEDIFQFDGSIIKNIFQALTMLKLEKKKFQIQKYNYDSQRSQQCIEICSKFCDKLILLFKDEIKQLQKQSENIFTKLNNFY